MKKLSQNDLIIIIVAAVIGIGCVVGFALTKPEPVAVAAPTTVTTSPAALPAPSVAMTTALPSGSGGGASGGRSGMMGGPGMGMPGGFPPGMGMPSGLSGVPGAPGSGARSRPGGPATGSGG